MTLEDRRPQAGEDNSVSRHIITFRRCEPFLYTANHSHVAPLALQGAYDSIVRALGAAKRVVSSGVYTALTNSVEGSLTMIKENKAASAASAEQENKRKADNDEQAGDTDGDDEGDDANKTKKRKRYEHAIITVEVYNKPLQGNDTDYYPQSYIP